MPQESTSTRERQRVTTKEPRKYRVIMHNDDVTTMEFVIKVLMDVFFKPFKEAESIMLEIHNHNQAIVGVYSYDIAQTKVMKVKRMAQAEKFPLKLTIEPGE